MRRSITVLVLILSIISGLIAQDTKLPKGKTRECGTVVSPAQIALERARFAQGYAELVPQANRPYRLPLTIHIVRLDDGTGGLTIARLEVAIRDLNEIWEQAGIQFYRQGAVDYINSDYFSFIPDIQERRDELRQVNPVANTINVWFTPQLDELCGQSTFTSDIVQGILMDNDCSGVAENPTTLAHEVGHYLDLYHTHETAFGVECPSGTNCSSTGDLFCSTAADPQLDHGNDVTEACVWTGSASIPFGCGTTEYNPPTSNVMSYSRRTCSTQFTSQQEGKVFFTLTTAGNRSALVNSFAKFVAPDGSSSSACTFNNPCSTLSRAASLADPGDNIFLLSGNYDEVTTITKRLFLKKWNTDAGTAVIGRP